MGKSAALSNFHLKAVQGGLNSYRAYCQPWNIVSTMAQTKAMLGRTVTVHPCLDPAPDLFSLAGGEGLIFALRLLAPPQKGK